MKVINLNEGIVLFHKIFKDAQGFRQKVVFWQVFQGHRSVSESFLTSCHHESRTLGVLPGDSEIILSHPLYFYIEDQQLIFKTAVESRNANSMTVRWPQEIHLLDEEENVKIKNGNRVQTFWSSKSGGGPEHINDYVRVKAMRERTSRDQDFLEEEFNYKSLDEEDKFFAEKRESPRVRPKADKLVKVVRKTDAKVNVMKLFDLSRGGMGFLTYNPDQFPKGMEVFVTGFDAFDLDDPLVGTIVSHRQVDETNLEFKIGIKFNEGQE